MDFLLYTIGMVTVVLSRICTTSIKVHTTGFAMDFLWVGLEFSPLPVPTIYVPVYSYERRVHLQIKGMARNKPLLVQRILICLCSLEYPVLRQTSPEKQKLSLVT